MAADLKWFCAGEEVFPAMLAAIGAARESVRLETYIYAADTLGRSFLQAMLQAQRRGVRVQVLVDALGSWLLPDDFFAPLIAAGGEVRRFNPLRFWRFGVRNHRKILVCDDRISFVGGYNISDEYDGDGITRGWRDSAICTGNHALAIELAASFDEMFGLAAFHRKPLLRLRAFKRKRKLILPLDGEILLSHPGRGVSPIQAALQHDLAGARDVLMISGYFLPPWRMRRDLARVVRRGGRVRLILAGKSDVLVAQLAGRSLYRRLLRAGVEIYEYQPQILHAKLMVIDGAAYVGSANLDVRSLKLNYELMLRFVDEPAVAAAREIYATTLQNSRRIERQAWRKSQTFWKRLKSSWAYFLLARVDPFIALRQFRAVKG